MSTHSKLSKRKKSPTIVLTYLDPRADTTIQTDASQKGAVWAAVLQHGEPICYASRAPTETELNDNNIERETLLHLWKILYPHTDH